MVNGCNEYEKYPICDTTMFIDLGLINKVNDLVDYHEKIFIAYIIKDELKRKINNIEEYKFLVTNTDNNSKIEIINTDIFTTKQLLVMDASLSQYLKETNLLISNKLAPNAGEFVSAIFAVNLGIKQLNTNDKKFIEQYGDEKIFEKLEFKNLNETLAYLMNDKDRIKYIKMIEERNEKMESILGQAELLLKLEKLQKKFNKAN
jgi:hypothetical protein